jgi:hypothetical protein
VVAPTPWTKSDFRTRGNIVAGQRTTGASHIAIEPRVGRGAYSIVRPPGCAERPERHPSAFRATTREISRSVGDRLGYKRHKTQEIQMHVRSIAATCDALGVVKRMLPECESADWATHLLEIG